MAPRARRGSNHAATVAALAAAKLEQRIALEVRSSSAAGVSVTDLVKRLGTSAETLARPLVDLADKGELVRVDHPAVDKTDAVPVAGKTDSDAHYLHATVVAEIERALVAAVQAPDGVSREAARATLPAALSQRAFDAIVDGLVARGSIASTGDRLAKPNAKAPTLSPIELRVLDRLADGKLEPLRPKELAPALHLTDAQVKTALDRLLAAKLVTRIKPDLLMHADAVLAIKAKLLAFLDEHKTIDAQQWKDLTGASRKFTIPLAEYFDAEKVTLRVGDLRRRR